MKNPVFVEGRWGGGGRNGVCLRERIRARLSRHTQELLGAKLGRMGHTHVSYVTV